MKKKLLAAVLCVAMVAATLVGCGSSDDGKKDGGKKSDLKVGVFYYTYADTYISSVRTALDKQLDDMGVDYQDYDGNSNQTTQNEQIDTAIQSGTNLLIVNIVTSGSNDASTQVIEKANQSGYVGVEPVPAVTADDDGTIRRIRTDRNAGILRIGPIVLPQTGLFRIVKRIRVHDIRQSSDTGERQAVPIDHADGQLGPPMNRTYRETDGIGVVGDDGERGLAPVVAASVIAEVFQICRAGFGRNIGRDASVSAMCVNWRGGAVGGHPLAVNPAYLTAKAGGGTVDEIPETQGIGLCTPSFGAGHTPRVMVEIDAVKTVVVHHVGVQPAIRTMVDVLEEHAVQPPACVMGGASHANPHHGFDCRGNGAER